MWPDIYFSRVGVGMAMQNMMLTSGNRPRKKGLIRAYTNSFFHHGCSSGAGDVQFLVVCCIGMGM
jgi:hypothetical protein